MEQMIAPALPSLAWYQLSDFMHLATPVLHSRSPDDSTVSSEAWAYFFGLF